ncbi:MAG: pyridoxamine 5'-phosphate oxidase family protein [Saprospiraceae bacterium]|nr:pyridoxamine 5'-phosphate oxidase family protein [Saprospiraceae bacterium]
MKERIEDKIRVRRVPKRGIYERDQIYAILDRSYICHVGFIFDGYPVVIPTAYGRVENDLYLHGSQASRMMKTGAQGVPLSVSTTVVNGLVLAKSVFHHSMNYESVVVFGKATAVLDQEEKMTALAAISDHIIKGRWQEARLPNPKELKATMVLKLSLDEASAKVRTGPPKDEEADLELPIWSGVVPLKHVFGMPESASYDAGLPIPESVNRILR